MSFDGMVRSARTNTFGYFAFGDVPTGASYVVSVESRRYAYQSALLNLDDSVTDLVFEPIQ